jgi:hypothetical protein
MAYQGSQFAVRMRYIGVSKRGTVLVTHAAREDMGEGRPALLIGGHCDASVHAHESGQAIAASTLSSSPGISPQTLHRASGKIETQAQPFQSSAPVFVQDLESSHGPPQTLRLKTCQGSGVKPVEKGCEVRAICERASRARETPSPGSV